MKKLALEIIFIIQVTIIFAQSPQSFQYQAVVRDASGSIIPNQTVNMQISILQGSASGSVLYSETHQPTTNNFGLVNLAVGNGTVETGTFAGIDWANGPYFIKVEIDPTGGTSFIDMGTSQLLSVPYALFAETAGNAGQTYSAGSGIDISGNTISNTALDQTVTITGSGATTVSGSYPNFSVSSTDNVDDADASATNELQSLSLSGNYLSISSGNTISLTSLSDTLWKLNGNDIYNSNSGNVGIGINTPPGRLVVQGSATAAITDPLFEVKNRLGQTVFVVYEDSVHVYVKDDGSKANKGAFAVSGRNSTKAFTNDFLTVNPDQSRVYTSDPEEGFGVGDLSTGSVTSYMNLTPDNYFIGHESGISNNTGLYNSFIGYMAGRGNIGGNSNTFIGYKSGMHNMNGYNNIFIGDSAGTNCDGLDNVFIGVNSGTNNVNGYDNIYIGSGTGFAGGGQYNVFIGEQAGAFNNGGSINTFIGQEAGYSNVTGDYNVYLGSQAGYANQQGLYNVFIGDGTGRSNLDSNNTFIGSSAGYFNEHGRNNVYIGYNTGLLSSGSGNIFIGHQAGYTETGSNLLIVENTSNNISPLIWGDFSINRVVINGSSTSNLNNRTFFVNGSAGGTGAWWNDSDKRLKKNIKTIADPLNKVIALRGVNYEWDDTSNHDPGLQMGFIAQEVKNIIPEVVSLKNDHYSMQYAPITALLVEAIKEQQKQIEILKKENQNLKTETQDLRSEINNIKTSLGLTQNK